ncbi:hypothetical protein NKH18_27275 [Streptomyces sp. M10(2022)]
MEPTVWYPSLKLLRSIVPASTGTVEAAQPQHSRRPATYFRLTDPKTGLVSDLYVSVARSATGTSLLPPGPAGCRDGHGPELTTSWGGHPFKCSVTWTKSGTVCWPTSWTRNPCPLARTARPIRTRSASPM